MSFVKVVKLFHQAIQRQSTPHLEQVALAFQKYLKEEKDVREMESTEGCVDALRHMISNPPTCIAWRRGLAALCNVSAMESRHTLQWIWQSGLVECAVRSVLPVVASQQYNKKEENKNSDSSGSNGGDGGAGGENNGTPSLEPTTEIKSCVTRMLSNLVIDTSSRACIAGIEDIVSRLMDCLCGSFPTESELVEDIFIVLGQLVLEAPVRVELERRESQQSVIGGTRLVDLVYNALDIPDLVESASTCLWNLTNNSTIMRKHLVEKGAMDKLVAMSKLSQVQLSQNVIANINYVIQILSSEAAAAESLNLGDLVGQLETCTDQSILGSTVGTLWNMTRAADKRDEAIDAGAISNLLMLLKSHATMTSDTLYKILGTLSTFCMVDRGAKDFASVSGVPLLLQILDDTLSADPYADSSETSRVVSIGLTLLNNAAMVPENRLAIRRNQGALFISKCLLHSMRYPDRLLNVMSAATSVCINLSVDDGDGESVFDMMRSEGILDALVELLKEQNAAKNIPHDTLIELQKKASSALWNLAIHESNLSHLEESGAIALLVQHIPEIANIVSRSSDCPKLTMRGYYTQPSLRRIGQMTTAEIAQLKNFCVGHKRNGFVIWPGETNVCGLDLDGVITIGKGYVDVDSQKVPVLNKPAIVTLARVTPKKGESVNEFIDRLKQVCADADSHFISYDIDKHEWCFQVEHFSRIGLADYDSDNDDDDDDDNDEFTEIDLDSDEDDEELSSGFDVDESRLLDNEAAGDRRMEALQGHILGTMDAARLLSDRKHLRSDQHKKRYSTTLTSALSMVRQMGGHTKTTSGTSSLVDRGYNVAQLSKAHGSHGRHLRNLSIALVRVGERLTSAVPSSRGRSSTISGPCSSSSSSNSGDNYSGGMPMDKPSTKVMEKDAIDVIMDTCYEMFLDFSKAEHSSENVLLYNDILHFWKIINNRQIHLDEKLLFAKHIGNTYLRDGCDQEVNISRSIRNQVLEDIFCHQLSSHMFDPLIHTLKGNLADIYNRFVLSPQYHTYLRTLDVKRGALQKYLHLLPSSLFTKK